MTHRPCFPSTVLSLALLLCCSPSGAASEDLAPLDGVTPPYALAATQDFGQVIDVGEGFFVTGSLSWTTSAGHGVGAILVAAPDEAGNWRPVAWEEGPDPGVRPPYFGTDVAASGERFVVGAFRGDYAEPGDHGIVFQYRYDPLTRSIEETGRIERPEPRVGNFGASVALDEEWLMIAATMDGGHDGGAVFVYRWEPTMDDWSLRQKLQPPDFDQQETGRNAFGHHMAMHYPWLMVYASSPYLEAENGSGALYVYRHDEAGDQWVFHQKLSDDPDLDFFHAGSRPFTDGEWLVFGSRRRDEEGVGTAYLHVYQLDDEDEWVRMSVLEGPRNEADGYFASFGWGSAIRNDRLYAGHSTARLSQGSGEGVTRGVVWLYDRDESHPDGWALSGHIEAPYAISTAYTNPRDAFGIQIALLDEDELLIGAIAVPLYGVNRVGQVWRYGPGAYEVQLQWSDAGVEGEEVTGAPFTQLIRIDNSGHGAATNVHFQFTRHVELELVDANVGCGVGPQEEAYHCLIPHIPADGHFILELELRTEREHIFQFHADMISDQPDMTPENRSGEWTLPVARAPEPGSSSSSGCSMGRGPWELLLLILLAGLISKLPRTPGNHKG